MWSTLVHRTSIVLALFVALTAGAGGALLIADPTGGRMGLALALLSRSPFESYLVPGLVLAFVVGGAHAVAGGLHVVHHRAASNATRISGVLLGGWILVQMLLIRELHAFQFLYLAVGALELALAAYRPIHLRAGTEYAIRDFLAQSRVAFVGLSADDKDFSRTVARALSDHGIDVVPVNPAMDAVGSVRCWPQVSAMRDPPKVALLMTPPSQAMAVLADCVRAGVGTVWFHRGVGAGSGTPEAIAAARAAGLVVIEDACPLMFLEPTGGLHHAHRDWRFDGEGVHARPDQAPPTGHPPRA